MHGLRQGRPPWPDDGAETKRAGRATRRACRPGAARPLPPKWWSRQRHGARGVTVYVRSQGEDGGHVLAGRNGRRAVPGAIALDGARCSVVARARAANTKPQGALHADRCARTCRWVVPPATLFLPEPLAVAAHKGSSGVPPAGTQRVLERAAGFVLRDGSAARVVALLDRPEAVQPAEGVVDPVVYRDERRGRLGAGGRRGGYGEDQYGQQVRETQADAASSRERDGTGRGCRSAGTNTDTSVPVFTRRSRHRGRTRRCCASRGVRCAGSSRPPALAAMADGRRHG